MSVDQGALPPNTTHAAALVVAGQRRINLIWECTQALIALGVVTANMIVAVYQGLDPGTHVGEFPVVLSSSLFLVIGFYFSRTNHTAVGGIGRKPQPKSYVGR